MERFDPVLLVALALAAGAPLAVAPLETSAAVVVCLVILWRRVGRVVLVAAVVLVALQGWRARAELADARVRYEATADALMPRARCEIDAVVLRSPVVVGAGARVDVTIERGRCEAKELPRGSIARLYAVPDLGRGDQLSVLADLGAVHLFHNPGVGEPHLRTALTGVTASGVAVDVRIERRSSTLAALVDRARAAVRARIEATFAPQSAPYARALVLGETDLDDDDRNAFRKSGLAHLLAVSGTHLVLVVLTFARLLSTLLVRFRALAERLDVGRVAAAACVPLAWLYADFAGGGGSALRAAAMLSLAMLARAAGRRPCAFRCFAVSLAGGALVEPLAIADLSFALSVAATSGLLLTQVASRQPRLLRALVATAAATAACAPVFLGTEPELPVLGVAANVLAAPPGELAALPLCLAHALLWWAPAAERGAALLAGGALEVVSAIAHAAAESPFAVVRLTPPTATELAALACTAMACWRFDGKRKLVVALGVVALAACELHAMRAGAPRDVVRITLLDVGQGDSILVDLPDGKLMLIDGGGLVGSAVDTGTRAVLPVLRARRRDRIDIAVLSHPHPDHYGGWMSVLSRVEVGEIWDSGLSEVEKPDGALARFFAAMRERGVVVKTARELCGEHAHGDATIEVLAPCPTFDRNRGANDNSLVLRIGFGARSALLTGDAEREEESALPLRHADFLKVGHHGSRTSSSSRMLDAVAPSHAAISCGVRNRFGHPHREALDRLVGVEVRRTDREGAIVWETDGDEVYFGSMADR